MKSSQSVVDRPKLIGIISDTHGLLRPEAVEALAGVELILHAGDMGSPAVLEALKQIAPVIAVRGNNDKGEWAESIAHHEVVELGAVSIYMLHDVKELALDPAAIDFKADCKVVVSGHSHQPKIERRQDILYVNPGSAGPRRFKLPISLALMRINGTSADAEIVKLQI